jgi:hypothetical protein
MTPSACGAKKKKERDLCPVSPFKCHSPCKDCSKPLPTLLTSAPTPLELLQIKLHCLPQELIVPFMSHRAFFLTISIYTLYFFYICHISLNCLK